MYADASGCSKVHVFIYTEIMHDASATLHMDFQL